MNTPHDHHDHCDPTDPILQSLADEAADLPAHAAHEARLRKMRHMRRRYHAASAITILFVGVCSWTVITTSEHRPASVAEQHTAPETDPDKPTASAEPSSPIAPTSPNSPTSPFAREAPDNPSPSPTPEIATSKPMPAPRPDGARAHPAPPAPLAAPDSFKRSATVATEVSGAFPRDFVKVQTEEEAMRNPLPLPEGLDAEQQELFKAARGLPLLLVRDSTGKVLRIHVIER